MSAKQVLLDFFSDFETDDALCDNWAEVILANFKAYRIAVVELASEAEMEDYGLSATPVHGEAFGLPVAEEVPDENGMTRTRFRSVSETRNYAAALLAAADAAEVAP